MSFFSASTGVRTAEALGGLACAGLILVVLAFMRAPRVHGPATEVYTARLVTLPFDEPPPPPREETPPVPGPLVGPLRLEIAPEASSAVHLQVPDVPRLDAETPPPPARAVVAARFDVANSIAHPVDHDDRPARRIFSRDEVDRRPMVVYRVKPKVSDRRVGRMATPRVGLLLVVNTDGSVGDVRVMRGSGEEDFDQTIVDTIREWRFSPAILKGHKVRCWVEQMVSVKVSGATPFEAR
ncbi:MAG TPA: energy transducer TonB [Opitutaceae bacterium]